MEVLSNIGFDWQVALANFVSFLIIFFILKKWVFGPVAEILERRKALIQEGVETAERSANELASAQEEAQLITKEARKEANEIVAKAKGHGDVLIASAEGKAQEQAQKVLAKAQESIQKEKKDAERELFEKTASLVSLGVAKILNEDVDEARDKTITKRALETLQKEQ